MNRRSFFSRLCGAVVAAGVALKAERLMGEPVTEPICFSEFELAPGEPLWNAIESIDRERGIVKFKSPVDLTQPGRIGELWIIHLALDGRHCP